MTYGPFVALPFSKFPFEYFAVVMAVLPESDIKKALKPQHFSIRNETNPDISTR